MGALCAFAICVGVYLLFLDDRSEQAPRAVAQQSEPVQEPTAPPPQEAVEEDEEEEEEEEEEEIAEETVDEDAESDAIEESLVLYTGSSYAARVPSTWTLVTDSERNEGGLVESKWEHPEDPEISVLIDVIAGDKTARQAASTVRRSVSAQPGYEELDFSRTEIAGQDAWRWQFRVPDGERVDYFVSMCGQEFAVLGAAPPERFDEYAFLFEEVAMSIEGCD